MAPVRIESIDCDVQIEPGRKVATIESVRLLSDTIEPGHELKAFVTLKPYKGERETIEVALPIPADFPEGPYEAVFCDAAQQRPPHVPQRPVAARAARPGRASSHAIRVQTEPKRTAVYLHVPSPDRGLSVQGQALPNLPGSVRAVFASKRETPTPPIRTDLVRVVADRMGRRGDRSRSGSPWPRTRGSRYRCIVEAIGQHRPAVNDNEARHEPSSRMRLGDRLRLRLSRILPGRRLVVRRHAGTARRPGPRSRPGGRKGRRRSPRATAKAWSSPTTAGSGSAMRSAPVGSLDAGRVWDLARTRDGVLLAATGDAGKVFRREPKADAPGPSSTTPSDSQALSLVVCPDGTVFAGTGPTGQVVNLTDPKHPGVAPRSRRSSTSGTWPPTRKGTSTRPPARRSALEASHATASGRCSTTARPRICSAWRSARTARSTPAATAKG